MHIKNVKLKYTLKTVLYEYVMCSGILGGGEMELVEEADVFII